MGILGHFWPNPKRSACLNSQDSYRRCCFRSGLVSVATALGLRLGEALGLQWADVDLDAGTLRVRWALERSGGDSTARRPLIIERRDLRTRIRTLTRTLRWATARK